MKTIVIYHRADFDGIFSREIAKAFFGPEADYVGWDYGDPLPVVEAETELYMIDISVDGLMDFPGLTWIDHHKSAIEKFSRDIRGYRIDGVAACRLAYQWFFRDTPGNLSGADMPTKEDYFDRRVVEPVAVRLAGEYDIWDKRDPRAELFQHGLRSMDLDGQWHELLSVRRPSIEEIEKMHDVGFHSELVEADGTVAPAIVHALLENGRGLQYSQTHQNESIINACGFTIEFEGLKFLACNHARYNSHLFTAGLKPEHDGCLGFNYDGKGQWRVSLYHAPGKEQHDLSLIAVKHGGGGHRGACGFKAEKLPFLP